MPVASDPLVLPHYPAQAGNTDQDQPIAFQSSWRRLPLEQLVQLWVTQSNFDCQIIKENHFDRRVMRYLRRLGLELPGSQVFGTHDRSAMRALLVLQKGERETSRPALMRSLSHFLWDGGYSQKNCLLLALLESHPVARVIGRRHQQVLALIVARAQVLPGERSIPARWPPPALQNWSRPKDKPTAPASTTNEITTADTRNSPPVKVCVSPATLPVQGIETRDQNQAAGMTAPAPAPVVGKPQESAQPVGAIETPAGPLSWKHALLGAGKTAGGR
ncbi:MAG: hypothetical protein KDK39_04480, partial [Leptospiraceae bacterium]|nr:hypothetical protein [Leptospiraceae bacterium]